MTACKELTGESSLHGKFHNVQMITSFKSVYTVLQYKYLLSSKSRSTYILTAETNPKSMEYYDINNNVNSKHIIQAS